MHRSSRLEQILSVEVGRTGPLPFSDASPNECASTLIKRTVHDVRLPSSFTSLSPAGFSKVNEEGRLRGLLPHVLGESNVDKTSSTAQIDLSAAIKRFGEASQVLSGLLKTDHVGIISNQRSSSNQPSTELSRQTFRDPVVAADGHENECDTFEQWISCRKIESLEITDEILKHLNLSPQKAERKMEK